MSTPPLLVQNSVYTAYSLLVLFCCLLPRDMLSILSTLPLISSMFYTSSPSGLPQNSAYCTPSLVLFRFCLYFFSSTLPSTLRTSTSLHSHSISSFLAFSSTKNNYYTSLESVQYFIYFKGTACTGVSSTSGLH